jgi:transcriptional regulator with XRE-family HTH domain
MSRVFRRVRDYDDFIANIKILREKSGMTQQSAGMRLGVQPRHAQRVIWRWESQRVIPKAPVLFELAHALGYDVALVSREP